MSACPSQVGTLVDKYLLLCCARRPPPLDETLHRGALALAPWACWFHFAIATWAFGPPVIEQVPTDITWDLSMALRGDGTRIGVEDPLRDFHSQFNVDDRIMKLASFPQFIAFLVTSLFLIVKVTWPLWATLGGAAGTREAAAGQGAGQVGSTADGAGLPPLSEVRKGAAELSSAESATGGAGGAPATPDTPEAAQTVGRKLLQEQARSEEPRLNLHGFQWKAREYSPQDIPRIWPTRLGSRLHAARFARFLCQCDPMFQRLPFVICAALL